MRSAFFAAVLLACGGRTVETASSGVTSACPAVTEPAKLATIKGAAELGELSGIAPSALNPGVFWVHNDSGDTARAFAVDGRGQLLTTLDFVGADAVDIEDVAIGDSFLYLADIGDNGSAHASVSIVRVPEPVLDGTAHLAKPAETMQFVYPDGAHDAETLLFDPLTKDLLVGTKSFTSGTTVYRLGRFVPGGRVTATRIASVAIGFSTAGAISRDGTKIAIRNYTTAASLWIRTPSESIEAALARPPCTLPVFAEPQGEAFGFLPDGSGYVTTSEGDSPEIHVARFE